LPLSLEYLAAIGVDAASAVELVVITHWHDDHVRGIASVVEKCSSSRVAISHALTTAEFLTLTSLFRGAAIPEGSGVDELADVLSIVSARRRAGVRFGSPALSGADRKLLNKTLSFGASKIDVEVHSLSPSDESVIQSKVAFADLISPGTSSGPIAAPTENHLSVVLVVDVGADRILLGADLEALADSSRGWKAIIESSTVAPPPAHTFKIPHHGAASGHDEEVWTKLLVPNPFAVLTPFIRGRVPLPTPSDVARIKSATRNAYATSLPSTRRYRPSDGKLRSMVEGATKSIENVQVGHGHVRLRKFIGAPAGAWNVELFGDAKHLI
jgi:hypothetical protein